jgi:hypothetical protein
MTETKQLLERAQRQFPAESDVMDALVRRRDRRRRNQRVAAGVVRIAVFVAAIWVVTSVGPLDRSDSSVVPGGDVTGPAETGRMETGPTETSHDGWDGNGIPPKGVALSTPTEGEIVDRYARYHAGYVFVYADGRVIWHRDGVRGIYEQRLTPEGLETLRSGPFGDHPIWKGQELLMLQILYQADGTVLPTEVFDVAGAWADPRIRPYAPARFAICFSALSELPVDPSHGLDLLPEPAQALLRGKEHTYQGAGPVGPGDPDPPTECSELTTEEARALDQILSDAGVERHTQPDSSDVWFVFQRGGERVEIYFNPLFPHGLWHYQPG